MSFDETTSTEKLKENNTNEKGSSNKSDAPFGFDTYERKDIEQQEEDDYEDHEADEEEEWQRNNEIDFSYYTLNELKAIINRCHIELEFNQNENKNDVNVLRSKLRSFTRTHSLMVLTPQEVHTKLQTLLKVKNVNRVCHCFKSAVMQGFIPLCGENGETDQNSILNRVIYVGPCSCGDDNKTVTVRIRDVLYQKDYGGDDYSYWNSTSAGPVECPDGNDGCGKSFFIQMCDGPNHWAVESGKFFNHCTKCPNFGVCIGDYREGHCDTCRNHYYSCRGRFPCDTCNPDIQF